jgi:hypothetical protein
MNKKLVFVLLGLFVLAGLATAAYFLLMKKSSNSTAGSGALPLPGNTTTISTPSTVSSPAPAPSLNITTSLVPAPAVSTASQYEGQFLQGGSATVWYVQGGKKRGLASPEAGVKVAGGDFWPLVKRVSEDVLASIPTGEVLY